MKLLMVIVVLFATNPAFASEVDDMSGVSVKGVAERVLKSHKWDLEWRIVESVKAPAVQARYRFNLGVFLREIMRQHIAINRDITVLVCDVQKKVIVYREIATGDITDCNRLFNPLDFVE